MLLMWVFFFSLIGIECRKVVNSSMLKFSWNMVVRMMMLKGLFSLMCLVSWICGRVMIGNGMNIVVSR